MSECLRALEKFLEANDQLKPNYRALLLKVFLVSHLQRKHCDNCLKYSFIGSAMYLLHPLV